MSGLGSPAIGRKLRDPEQRRAILTATPRDEWIILARAYLTEIGCPPDEQHTVILGVLYIWQQQVKEYNAAAQSGPDRSQPDRAGERSRTAPQSE